jgi:L-amino acid N-acyltransferase YncA
LSLSLQFGNSSFLQDYKKIYGYYTKNSLATFDIDLPSDKSITQRINSESFPYLFLMEGANTVGFSYLYPHGDRQAFLFSVNYGVYLDPQKAGRGLGNLLAQRIIKLAEELGFISLYAAISGNNTGSIALQNKLGLNKIGHFPRAGYKHKQWIDVLWYYRPLAPFQGGHHNNLKSPFKLSHLNKGKKSEVLQLE